MKIIPDLLPKKCFDAGRTAKLEFIVLHATAGSSYAGAKSAYLSRGVSAHYTIEKDGTIYQNVLDQNTAWHAGESIWGDINGLNPHSIGIEIVGLNTYGVDYPDAQIQSVVQLVKSLCDRHKIRWTNILTHYMISPNRKTDPQNFPIHEVLSVVRGEPEQHKVFLNGVDITGQSKFDKHWLVVNAENPRKTYVSNIPTDNA
ncbi:MAG: hypothetical protein RLZZ156_501 [Deinococcota bacterium]|jgi:N-acetylmuramoyl-L-alanine amidase